MPLVYDELCKLAAQQLKREKSGQTLQATASAHLAGAHRDADGLAGKPNKSIAHSLDLSIRSIDFRRASILRKMQASVVELIQMVMLEKHIHSGLALQRQM